MKMRWAFQRFLRPFILFLLEAYLLRDGEEVKGE
jgi:hypothetical protein